MNPLRHDSSSDDLAVINDAAAAWVARRDRGFTAAEQDEFLQWLAADPRHGERFAWHQRGWNQLAHLAQWCPEHASDPNPDVLAPARRQRPRSRLLRWALPLTLAAAAAAMIMLQIDRPTAPMAPPAKSVTADLAYRQQVLDDGSLVELNHGATVEIAFSTRERLVRLVQGEALFTVAKNPDRPFVVEAGGVQVRAVGTAFNVRLAHDAVDVLVTEGRVQLTRPASPLAETPILAMGERALVPRSAAAPTRTSVTRDEIDRALVWQPRLLEFAATPLVEVAEAFNRRNRVQLIVADPALASLPIGTSFRSDNVDGFVRLLEVSFGIVAERRENAIWLHRAR